LRYHPSPIATHQQELPFPDGTCPDTTSIDAWLALVEKTVAAKSAGELSADAAVAVHCVAGLGRAPLMVGIALVSSGMAHTDAVQLIRKVRRGALNIKQLEYLASYKPKKKAKDPCDCLIS
jgi:protein tyrosine phosphatase type 4A